MIKRKKEIVGYPEVFIALACAVGTDSSIVIDELTKQFSDFNYKVELIKISEELLKPNVKEKLSDNAYERTDQLMNQGNLMRKESGKDILARGAIVKIREKRKIAQDYGSVYIIDSLKHPDEVHLLKETYTSAFYLFAINEFSDDRSECLVKTKNIGDEDATKLIQRDEDEIYKFGQHTKQVFELADFHLLIKKDGEVKTGTNTKNKYRKEFKRIKTEYISKQLSRIIDLMFGHPYITPTFDEYAMFMAYSSSLRSADLSRQVGAVIAKSNNIIATGSNDAPKYGGGQYWPSDTKNNFEKYQYDENEEITEGYDIHLGRDYTLGYDPNKVEIESIADSIVEQFDYEELKISDVKVSEYKRQLKKELLKSKLKDITEYGRVVHAEMAAMLSCANLGIPLNGATLYCTTFPCHNCARHAIFAGIERCVFIEPYLKSRALDLHKDSMSIKEKGDKVIFEQFVGVGPRRFYDLFSLKLSQGRIIMRKEDNKIVEFNRKDERLRCESYLEFYLTLEDINILNYSNKYNWKDKK